MLIALEAMGIVAFAFAGATSAMQSRLDIFGVLVAASVTAIGGGVMRDVLLGVHPPVGLLTGWYFIACTITALAVFFCYPWLSRLKLLTLVVRFADAVGLAMFTVTGASKSVELGAPWYAAAMVGMINAIGGGMVIETLLLRIPMVLRRDIYALPALGGGLIMALGTAAAIPATPMTLVVVALVVSVRMVAVTLNWNLPVGRLTASTKHGPAEFWPVLPTEPWTERTVELPRLASNSSPQPPRGGWSDHATVHLRRPTPAGQYHRVSPPNPVAGRPAAPGARGARPPTRESHQQCR